MMMDEERKKKAIGGGAGVELKEHESLILSRRLYSEKTPGN
jgi:hypothetical protein